MATVSEFLIERLENAGIKHVFGVPGDYVLDFYTKLWNSLKIKVINTTDETHAGFAADAYARINGIGCCCTTYNVGTLKVANACACAYAERSPVVVISGSPGMKEREEGHLLHHMVRSFNCQHDIFKNLTCASVVLDNQTTAGYLIDKAFESLQHYKQPIYIELPRDIANKSIVYDVYDQGTPQKSKSDPENLEESLSEVSAWINTAKNPAILAGVELARYGLQDRMVKFAEKLNIPVATTLLSKSTINETHPLFAGVYSGSASHEYTRRIVDGSDCLLMFGVMLTDISLNFRPSKFNKRQVVNVSVSGLQVRTHTFANVGFSDFCTLLFKSELGIHENPDIPVRKNKLVFTPKKNQAITTRRLFEKVNSVLDKNMSIVADIGDSLFGAGDLIVQNTNHFLSPAFYTSMGFAIPGALGVQMARPSVRPIVLVGDGAFQMSMTELSTIIQHNLNPIVIIMNNDGYATERLLRDGEFNNIRRWKYYKVVDLLDGGFSAEIRTEEDLDKHMTKALESKSLYILDVVLDGKDISDGMRRMADALSKRI
jgi:indolepyruvate decarboxylase